MSSTATTALAAGTYTVDPAHSSFGFAVKHLGIANVRGRFREFEGKLELGDDLAGATLTGSAKTASVETGEPQRDDHLRSSDFFDAETYPDLVFESTSVTPVDAESFEIEGNLTMHGVTHPVKLTGEALGTETDPWGNERAAFELTGKLNRSDWGMKFNSALGSGNLVVSDTVRLSLDISAVKQTA